MPNYRKVATRKARKYGLNPRIFRRQINAESGFNPKAGSPAGAQGIAQIMPETAASWGVDPSKPRRALDAAARHMAESVKAYKGDYRLALAAYNAGPGAVQKYGGVPPYGETQAYIAKVLKGIDPVQPLGAYQKQHGGKRSKPTGKKGRPGAPGKVIRRTTKTVTPAVDNSDLRKQLKLDYLSNSKDPGALLKLASSLGEAKDIAAKTIIKHARPIHVPGQSQPGPQGANRGERRANRLYTKASKLDRMHQPYQWGGGHGATPDPNGPWDCSGAVSALFGISPRVSGQFASWGKPGKGKWITVYANEGHVIMSIRRNGKERFWGTSDSNPDGGAGWIDASQISPGYLAGFTVRHPG